MDVYLKKNGFTLVEILGIIVVLSLIFMFSFINLSNTTKKNKENEYKMFVNDLCLAGQNYIYLNLEKYPQISNAKSEISIEISDLINKNLIDKNLVNPRTNSSILNDYLIYTVQDDYELRCEYNNS